MEKKTFSLTSEGMLPYIGFPDLEAFANSLSLKEMEEWDIRLSKKEGDSEWIRAAIALYTIESGLSEAELTEEEIVQICVDFNVSMSIMHNIRLGHMVKTSGRVTLINSTANFKLTDQGIKYVKSTILPKLG